MVKVPPVSSSIFSLRSRAAVPRRAISLARSRSVSRSALRTTATVSPSGVCAAMPMLYSPRTTSSCVASSKLELRCGYFFSAAITAFTMNGRNVSFDVVARRLQLRVEPLAQRHQIRAVHLLHEGEVRHR